MDAATNVGFLLRQLPDADEVILVDGGSGDGTPDAACQARPDATVLIRPGVSRTAALAEGIARAAGDIILTLPIDGSADPDEVPAFVEALVAGADMAKGTRYVDPHVRPAGADRLLAWLGRRVIGVELSDLGHGFYGFWADQRDRLDLPQGERGSWTPEVDVTIACQLARAGARIVEVPVRRTPPLFGSEEPAGVGALAAGARAVLAERRRTSPRSVAGALVAAVEPKHLLV
ncbi:hypothetical protein JCM18899A_46510 [Nocardioides sp. AN3]